LIYPAATSVQLPALLDFPPPVLQGYSRESVIAEKYQAMVHHGEVNSRLKGFYDVLIFAESLINDLRAQINGRTRFASQFPVIHRAGLALNSCTIGLGDENIAKEQGGAKRKPDGGSAIRFLWWAI